MLLDNPARDIADVLVANAGVVRTLRRMITSFGETERAAVLIQEIFCSKPNQVPGSSRMVAREEGDEEMRKSPSARIISFHCF